MQDPGGDWQWHGVLPEDQRQHLVAAFNSGFRLNEVTGGFFAEGKEVKPLVDRAGSLVVTRAGEIFFRPDMASLELPGIRVFSRSGETFIAIDSTHPWQSSRRGDPPRCGHHRACPHCKAVAEVRRDSERERCRRRPLAILRWCAFF